MRKWYAGLALTAFLTIVFLAGMRQTACAAETAGGLSEYDFTSLQQVMDEIFQKKELDFGGMVRELLKGNTELSLKMLLSDLWRALTGEITAGRKAMALTLGIGIMAAIFYHISLAFENRQIADTGYFITYLAFLSVTVMSFSNACSIVEELLYQLELFMKALIPAFFLAVSAASGSVGALGFYKVMLIIVSMADSLLLKLILPVIKLSTVLMLVNYITKEELLSRLAKLFQTVVSWSLKGMLSLVIGMNAMQGMILPTVDDMKLSVLQKTISILPGIGNSAEAVAGLMAQSGELIKDGIGTAAFLVIAAITLIPIVKLGILILMYQVTCAMLQPVSDKRMVKALGAICEGSRLLLQLAATAGILYMVTIAVVCMTT